MFFSVLFCTVRLSIFERFVFASFEPLRFCKKVRFVFPDLFVGCIAGKKIVVFHEAVVQRLYLVVPRPNGIGVNLPKLGKKSQLSFDFLIEIGSPETRGSHRPTIAFICTHTSFEISD